MRQVWAVKTSMGAQRPQTPKQPCAASHREALLPRQQRWCALGKPSSEAATAIGVVPRYACTGQPGSPSKTNSSPSAGNADIRVPSKAAAKGAGVTSRGRLGSSAGSEMKGTRFRGGWPSFTRVAGCWTSSAREPAKGADARHPDKSTAECSSMAGQGAVGTTSVPMAAAKGSALVRPGSA